MFGNIRENIVYKIVFPVAIYFVLYNLLYALCNYAIGGAENGMHLFDISIDPLYCVAISAVITSAVIYKLYKNANIYSEKPYFSSETIFKEILYIIGIIAIGLVLNLIMTNFPMSEISEGFNKANEFLNDGDIIAKILANAIVVPFMEEMVFRGIVCGEIDKKYNPTVAIFVSAGLFAILHFNWVQMIYAFIVGLFIGYVYENTHKLWVCYAGHALLNLSVVLICYLI